VPALIIRNDVGDRHRWPECARFWECCPNCSAWFLPFAHWNHLSGCPDCGLACEAKTPLRLPNDDPRGRTLRELRADPGVPQFEPLDGSEATPDVDYSDDGEVSV
jgi:predicted  nucleic acid-binding Zn-ribbon protein